MAVFVSASDETDGGREKSIFWYAGLVANETDWTDVFSPAWQERVLSSHPAIPYLHMTEIRDRIWQKQYSLTDADVEVKLDAATALIESMGNHALFPVAAKIDGGSFLNAFGKKKIMRPDAGGKAKRFLIDHLCFMSYVPLVLAYVRDKHPEAEKVDFIVERKEGVFAVIEEFHKTIKADLKNVGLPELSGLIGEVIPAGKDRVPLQAADMLCWYSSRAELNALKGRNLERAQRLISRPGVNVQLQDDLLHGLAQRFRKKLNEQSK